ncbi:unnamed protein product, partial [Nesidiocoris tenuis]
MVRYGGPVDILGQTKFGTRFLTKISKIYENSFPKEKRLTAKHAPFSLNCVAWKCISENSIISRT